MRLALIFVALVNLIFTAYICLTIRRLRQWERQLEAAQKDHTVAVSAWEAGCRSHLRVLPTWQEGAEGSYVVSPKGEHTATGFNYYAKVGRN